MLLLTGAAGFIGSNVLKALNDIGRDDIICVDDLTNGSKCQNLAKKKFFRYYDCQDVLEVFLEHDIDTVVHLGANVDTSADNGRSMTQDNYSHAIRLLDFLQDSTSKNRHMIYASSAAVYGNSARGSTKPCQEVPEEEEPRSPYAVSKWMFDQYARRWLRAAALNNGLSSLTGLRFFNVYGPGEQHKGRMRSAIGTMLNDIYENRRPTLFDGSEWIYRDFVWIEDAVKTVLWAVANRPRGIFNVGTGVARSFQDAYNLVAAAADYDGHPQYVDFPKDLPYYQYFTQADLTNLRAAGFEDPFTTLEDGVKKYADFQR